MQWTKEKVTEALAVVLTTVAETNLPKPHTSPQTHLYLGLQTVGALDTIDDWYAIQDIGRKLCFWTHTSETLTLTAKGLEMAARLEAQLGAA